MRGALRLARSFILWTAAGLGAGLTAALALPAVVGWQSLTVMSGSMEPTIGTGDVIVTRPVAPLKTRVGDVVTFHDPTRGGRLVSHRVRRIQIAGDRVEFETKGDANNTSERWRVGVGGRIGRVVYRVPRCGYLVRWLATAWVRRGLVTLCGLLLAGSALARIWRPTTPTPARRPAIAHRRN